MGVISHLYTRNTLKGKEASPRGISGDLQSLLTRNYLMVVVMATLVEAIFNILVTFVPVYFTKELGLSYSLTSIITGLGPLTGIAGSTLGGFIGDTYGRYRTGIIVLSSVGVLLLIFPGLNLLWIVLIVYALYRALQAAFMPLMNSMIAAQSSTENRSLSYSFNFVAVNLVAAITPPAISYLIELYNTIIIFPICIAAIILTCGIIYLLKRSQ
jgi:MFS family permease